MRQRLTGAIGLVAAAVVGFSTVAPAVAQEDTLHPIPAADCQQLAAKLQSAAGLATAASEDDFLDVIGNAEGRSCHIKGTATGLDVADANALTARLATVFDGWRDDPDYSDSGPDAADKGYVLGNRLAVVEVSWEPAPGVSCSDTLPLAACKVTSQQKVWTVLVDAVERAGK